MSVSPLNKRVLNTTNVKKEFHYRKWMGNCRPAMSPIRVGLSPWEKIINFITNIFEQIKNFFISLTRRV